MDKSYFLVIYNFVGEGLSIWLVEHSEDNKELFENAKLANGFYINEDDDEDQWAAANYVDRSLKKVPVTLNTDLAKFQGKIDGIFHIGFYC